MDNRDEVLKDNWKLEFIVLILIISIEIIKKGSNIVSSLMTFINLLVY